MTAIADPDGTGQTVHVRYRTTTPQGEWSDAQKTTSTTDSAEVGLSGLTPDTEYEAEVSLTSDFSVSETDVFRTLPPAPVVSGVSVDDETQTTATANISIANANGDSQTVHLRYRTTAPQGKWSETQEDYQQHRQRRGWAVRTHREHRVRCAGVSRQLIPR